MTAALLALGGALVTVLAYVWLTERLDYASVCRRQLDAWAAVVAFGCLSGMAYGGAEARQAGMARARQPAVRSPAPPEIRRVHQPSLRLLPDGSTDTVGDGVAAITPLGEPIVEEAPPAAAPLFEPAHVDAPEPDRRPRAAVVEAPGPTADAALPPATIVARQIVPESREVVVAATLAVGPPVGRPQIITPPPPVPTRAPPTLTPVPPTPEPIVEPSPTAHCGDPNRIEVRVDVTEAEADRRSDPQSVRYSARVRNDASFPIDLTGIVATAQDSRSGSDQFGSDRKPYDVTVEPGQWVGIDGVINLEKFPSPFGRSEVCVSFVPESCGQRSMQKPVARRCSPISGF